MTANAKPDPATAPLDAIDPRKALVPSVLRLNEMRVRKGFWPKVVRTAARIPFADQLVSVWYAARDPETPLPAKGMMLGALAYFVLPTDAIPDSPTTRRCSRPWWRRWAPTSSAATATRPPTPWSG